ncbi:MAG: imidazole glycerol phosphate synthase subunit HisH [Actinomycetota bacterium]
MQPDRPWNNAQHKGDTLIGGAPTIAVLDYGMGNLHSVSRAIETVGGSATVTAERREVADADALVIPGVGAFGAGVRALAERGLDGAIRDFVGSGRPVFAVCLGMQVLFKESDEDPEEGLSIVAGRSRKLPPDVKVPHMGWNTVEWSGTHPYVDGIPDGTRFYFVHSYAPDVIEGTTVGVTEHGRLFSSVVAKDNVFATQFHPEKSADAGLQIYSSFVKAVAGR